VDLAALRQSAAAGDARAQVLLARRLIIGREIHTDLGEAIRLIQLACAQNYPLALLLHASLAALGLGRSQNFDDAIGYVAQAAAAGDARAQGQLDALGGVAGFDPSAWLAPPRSVQHAATPRIFSSEGFLPARACAWLAAQASLRLQPAPVKDPALGSMVSSIRTNTGCGFSKIEADLVLQMTRLRIAVLTGLSQAHQEAPNVLHYEIGQQYRPHYDFVRVDEEVAMRAELEAWGQRAVTVLVYLNEDYDGGETEFPLLNWRFKGRTGAALMFWNLSASGERERGSLHAGLPVTSGRKWLLSQWVRQKPAPIMI